jgi:parallel beta-helix repeat protein
MFACLSAAMSLACAAQRHVDPGHRSASDSGAGAIDAPYRTLRHAMSQLQPGDHLIIASGVYRDALVFPQREWGSADTLIEGHGKVLVKGSAEVGGWKPLGEGRYVKEWTQEPSQVYVNGKPLQQIGGTVFDGYPEKPDHPFRALHQSQGGIWLGRKAGTEEGMPPASFHYSPQKQSLFIQLPAGTANPGKVEVSTRTYLMIGRNLDRVTVRNLSFAHGNTSATVRGGLVTLFGNRITAEGIAVSQADSIGIHLAGDDITLANSSANDCGQLGINARGRRMRLVNNETSGNNTRNFNKWWEAGGAKFVGDGGLQNSVLVGHKAFANRGDGIWFDWKNRNNRIENSISAYNQGSGIEYEASTGAVITGNVVVANGQRGIYLPHSSNSEISRNIVAGNAMEGIVVIDDGVRDPQGTADLRPRGNRVFANVVAWNAAALYLPAELADNRSDSNFYVGTPTHTRFSLGWPRRGANRLADWVSNTGQDRNSTALEADVDPAFAKSVSERRRKPDLEWIRSARAGEALQAAPPWPDARRAPVGG